MNSALVLTSEYYGSPHKIGSHSIADEFARRGIKTTVASFPTSPLYALSKTSTAYNIRKQFSKPRKVSKNLFAFAPRVLIPPIPQIVGAIPSAITNWHCQNKHILTSLKDLKPKIVLIETPFYEWVLPHLNDAKIVFRLPDNFSGFWGRNRALEASLDRIQNAADLVVTSSKLLQKSMQAANKNITINYLPNGFNPQIYMQKRPEPLNFRSSEYLFEAVYVGSTAFWFDTATILDTAEKMKHWRFNIIGNCSKLKKQNMPSNVRLIGPIANDNIPQYLQHADVGLIPFNVKEYPELVNYVNPLKLYEYLAAGLPVIASRWRELELINAPIMLADSVDDFISSLRKVEHCENNADSQNTELLQQFSWEKITDNLLNMLDLEGDGLR